MVFVKAENYEGAWNYIRTNQLGDIVIANGIFFVSQKALQNADQALHGQIWDVLEKDPERRLQRFFVEGSTQPYPAAHLWKIYDDIRKDKAHRDFTPDIFTNPPIEKIKVIQKKEKTEKMFKKAKISWVPSFALWY